MKLLLLAIQRVVATTALAILISGGLVAALVYLPAVLESTPGWALISAFFVACVGVSYLDLKWSRR